MRYHSHFLSLIFILVVSFRLFGKSQPTPDLYFPKLAHKMRLGTPKLKEGDYEIRVWYKCQLCFGEAHALYLLKKSEKDIDLSGYSIHFNRSTFKRSKQVRLRASSPQELWNRLLLLGILTLPDEAVIDEELHPKHQKDSTWHTIESDGSVSVHAKKTKAWVFILDGDSYHFEVFSANGFQKHTYGNPESYLKHRPEIIELKKVVSILNELNTAF